MLEKKGLLVYLAGAVMLAAAAFLPYYRYKFEMEGYKGYKETYSLLHLKDLGVQFVGIGSVSDITKLFGWLVLIAGLVGVAAGIFQMLSYTDIFSVGMLVLLLVPVIEIAAFIIVKIDKTVKTVGEFLADIETDMIDQGYSGSAGYGAGFWLLILGILVCVVGLVIYIRESMV